MGVQRRRRMAQDAIPLSAGGRIALGREQKRHHPLKNVAISSVQVQPAYPRGRDYFGVPAVSGIKPVPLRSDLLANSFVYRYDCI